VDENGLGVCGTGQDALECVQELVHVDRFRDKTGDGHSKVGSLQEARPASRHHENQLQSARQVDELMAAFFSQQTLHALPGDQGDDWGAR
jgi:hypothetical protein